MANTYVRHRIDGLEIEWLNPECAWLVRHRIDGLEIPAVNHIWT